MNWDLIMALAQVSLDIVLLPTVLRPTSYVPRFTSASTVVGLAVVAVALYHLGAPLGASSAGFGAGLWAAIFLLRGHAK